MNWMASDHRLSGHNVEGWQDVRFQTNHEYIDLVFAPSPEGHIDAYFIRPHLLPAAAAV
jgi:hypothetical protein